MQTAGAADIDASGALDLSDFLNRRFAGVFVNETQGNPFQPDLNYRGYTASPLLGTPQGLSIYMDGVRLNQPFGDVVSWDLIPRMAIGSTTLMPGSNPLFGLNTLGGALVDSNQGWPDEPGHHGPRDLRHRCPPSRGVRARRQPRERPALVSCRATSSPRTAGETPRRRTSASCSASSAGTRRSRYGALGRIRRQFADRQRPAGAAVSGPRLRQRLHEAGRDRQPRDVRESDHPARSEQHAELQRERVLPRHPDHTLNGDINDDSLDQAVYQPTLRNKPPWPPPATPDSRPAARTRPTHRFLLAVHRQRVADDEPGEKCNGLLNRSKTCSTTTACRARSPGATGSPRKHHHRRRGL